MGLKEIDKPFEVAVPLRGSETRRKHSYSKLTSSSCTFPIRVKYRVLVGCPGVTHTEWLGGDYLRGKHKGLMERRTWKRLPFGVKHHPPGHPPLRTGEGVLVVATTVHRRFTNGFEKEGIVVKVILDKQNIPLALFSCALNQEIQSPL